LCWHPQHHTFCTYRAEFLKLDPFSLVVQYACYGTDNSVFQRNEGGNVSLFCPFSSSEHTKFFCRNECKEEDILIRTDENRTQSELHFFVLRIIVKKLTKSDSGKYKCGSGSSLNLASVHTFRISVTEGEFESCCFLKHWQRLHNLAH
uniref:Immunoglobulin V-set domain-containing protein n=1 Tax=Monopterus albus TaxID=43700 RepID=A0A3Q3K353_MONAL